MLKFMKKIPGGTILIPMFVSALFYTFSPNLFKIGGVTQEFFTDSGLLYILGLACFCSGMSVSVSSLSKALKKQGSIFLVRTIVVLISIFLFIKLFGMQGIFGISAIAFVSCVCGLNPALYLAMMQEYGTEEDMAAFSIIGALSTPAYPMILFSLFSPLQIDYMPIISILIPMILGFVIGNLDLDFKQLFSPVITAIMPLLGWSLGSNINLMDAIKNGMSGILLIPIFYIVAIPIEYIFEKKVLKSSGASAISMAFLSGVALTAPRMIGMSHPELLKYVSPAVSQMTLGLVVTSILTPIIMKKLVKKENKYFC